jgi:parallel beta-helix repeat protein
MNGTYRNSTPEGDAVRITRSGTAAAWIVYRAHPGHNPRIRFSGWGGIHIWGADYIVVEGFEVEGNINGVTFADAEASKQNPQAKFAGTAIGVRNGVSNAQDMPHHVIVRNCHVYRSCGGGICTNGGDYITFENNVVHDCSWYSPFGNSGISIFKCHNYDDHSSPGNNIIVRNNVSYNNYNFFECKCANYTAVTDGNGIIFDYLNKNVRNTTYKGRVLVENNVCFNNGGRGINAFHSDNVMIVNNTLYMNCRHPDLKVGEIAVVQSANVKVFNNIAVARDSVMPIKHWTAVSIMVDYNLHVGSKPSTVKGANCIVAHDAGFKNADTIFAGSDFRLTASSAAVDAGSDEHGALTDLLGITRPQGGHVDMGAYEYTADVVMIPGKIQNRPAPCTLEMHAFSVRGRRVAAVRSSARGVYLSAGNGHLLLHSYRYLQR